MIATDRPDPSERPDARAGLAFGGGTGGTVPGGQPDRTYLAAYQSVEVTREVRLGEVTVVGGGRLVGEVWLLPPPRRGCERDYTVVLQLEARPGRDVDGVAFAWSDGAAPGADQLDLSLRCARRCAR